MNHIKTFLFAALLLSCNSLFAQNQATTSWQPNNNPPTHATYVPWPKLMENDIARKTRVWENIFIGDKGNEAFRSAESNTLINALVTGVRTGKIAAYTDSRFQHKMTDEEISAMARNNYIGSPARTKQIGAASKFTKGQGIVVPKYYVKEDSLFMKNGKINLRILGIAPVVIKMGSKQGQTVEDPIFWVYYPDCRSYLAQCITGQAPMTWDDVFEGRDFTAKIDSTVDVYAKYRKINPYFDAKPPLK